MARIVLDTDVVSLYRTGRLPADVARQVAANDLSIAFATAGELWKWALARRWGGTRRGGLELFLDQALILPASLKVRSGSTWRPATATSSAGPAQGIAASPATSPDTWIRLYRRWLAGPSRRPQDRTARRLGRWRIDRSFRSRP